MSGSSCSELLVPISVGLGTEIRILLPRSKDTEKKFCHDYAKTSKMTTIQVDLWQHVSFFD